MEYLDYKPMAVDSMTVRGNHYFMISQINLSQNISIDFTRILFKIGY